ncbi:hypothetical protein LTR53_009873 [Teratosphaeriaceae sp. CCFEE 6253]|nr:hypothetical protein LTR53_009873 [Teratosphaeriaceae sp. CCFEE 6253]
MGYTNFTQCGVDYLPLSPEIQNSDYGWHGSVRLIPLNRTTQISTLGCKVLCGTGSAYYEWNQASSTITTWVLPVIGVLLQAPFVSNAFWQTVFAIARWVGSPIASLAYTLWNIKVSGKCALLADMAGQYEVKDSTRDSDFASMRDSLYLLATLNQYSISPTILALSRQGLNKPAEGLLRVALFGKKLRLLKRQRVVGDLDHDQPVLGPTGHLDGLAQQLQAFDHTHEDPNLEPLGELNAMRQKLAQQLRETRRKGVVPVFLSTLWFLFALAISIQSAFGYLGQNAVAHDLALGLLLAWLPVLVLCTIVDRNPVSADDSRKRLNRLVDHVRKSLMDDQIRLAFVNSVDDVEGRRQMRQGIQDLGAQCEAMGVEPFFEQFSGQGRVKWHYGAAHAILCDIEEIYIARQGRHWLRNESKARTHLVLGNTGTGGLDWLDYRELLQVSAAFACVGGTTFGAWILSFFTPTVGLGCRSGGYTVFIAIATSLLVTEMILWWWWDAQKPELRDLHRRASHNAYVASSGEKLRTGWTKVQRLLSPLAASCATLFKRIINTLLPDPVIKILNGTTHSLGTWFAKLSPQQRWEFLFFRPVEAGNTAWLLYRILAQTFGSDNTCECMSSLWSFGGGYVDLTQ